MFFLGGGGGNSEAFNLSWPKKFFKKIIKVFGESSVLTQNQLYKEPKHSNVFIFNWSRFFFVKIQKCWGAPIETSDFLLICADFDRIWHKHAGLWGPGVRRSCEHARNVRTKKLEKADRAKTVRNRAKIREKKTLKKTGRAKIVPKRGERAKIRAKKNHRANGANISSKLHS